MPSKRKTNSGVVVERVPVRLDGSKSRKNVPLKTTSSPGCMSSGVVPAVLLDDVRSADVA